MRVLTIIALGMVVPAAATAQSIGDMLPSCEAALALADRTNRSNVDEDSVFCLGIAEGVMTTMWFNCEHLRSGLFSPSPILSASFPPSRYAAVQAFVNWARENPHEWGYSAAAGMANALALGFPCDR